MLSFFLLTTAFFVPSQSALVSSVLDFFFNSFDGDKFENVGFNKVIECGEDSEGKPRDCLILCKSSNSCANSTFKVKSGNIQIMCQMPHSCDNVYISAYGTQSLNMSFMASNAFLNGFYIGTSNKRVITQCSFGESCKGSTFYYNSDDEVIHNCSAWNGPEYSSYGACRHSTIVTLYSKVTLDFSNKQAFYPGAYFGYKNKEVTTYCRSSSACGSASFHYDSINPVKHYCMGGNSCAGAVIHALTRTDVDCAGKKGGSSTYSCYETALISATNNYSVTVHGDDYAPTVSNRVHLYLTSSYNIKDLVICEDDCKPDGLVYYAANDYNYEYNCSMENAHYCLDDLANRLDNEPFTVHDNYYWDAKGRVDEVWKDGALLTLHSKFPQKLWNENTWKREPKYATATLTAPKGLDDNDYMIFCLDCSKTDLYLENAMNAVIYTAKHEPRFSTPIAFNYIESSSNEFTFRGRDSVQNVTINATGAKEVDIVNVGLWAKIYVGEVENVHINCTWSQSCVGVDVYTDMNPMEEKPFSEHSEFNIECAHITYGNSACEFYSGGTLQYGLYIDFSFLNKRCRISADGPDTEECPFLSYYVRSLGGAAGGALSSLPGYALGLIIGGVVVLFVIVAVIFYRVRSNRKMSSEIYVNLTEDNKV